MSGGRAQRPSPVTEIVAAAHELLRTHGIGGVSVRAIAASTGCSSSTVGYHTAPFDEFVHGLWQDVGLDLLAPVLAASQRGEDTASTATALLRHADDAAPLIEFFTRHGVIALRPPDDDRWRRLGGTALDQRPAETTATLHYLLRRLQVAVARALDWPGHHRVRHELLAEELDDIVGIWHRFVGAAG